MVYRKRYPRKFRRRLRRAFRKMISRRTYPMRKTYNNTLALKADVSA